jgi:hypothetical protein
LRIELPLEQTARLSAGQAAPKSSGCIERSGVNMDSNATIAAEQLGDTK